MMARVLFLVLAGTPLPPGKADPLALNEAMKRFADEHVVTAKNPTIRLESLIRVVFSDAVLHLTYANGTKTAVETFESQSGNCLSFTNMFVALARYAGLKAQFQEVRGVSTWDRLGQLVVFNRHVNVVIRLNGQLFEVDFSPERTTRKRKSRIISDRRALAHYYNNKGAELFAEDEPEQALALFELAMATDDSVAHIWANAGVIHSRLNRLEAAELCYRKALLLEKHNYTAMTNLASVLAKQNRDDEAAVLLDRVDHWRRKNPFFHYERGQAAFAQGRFEEAVVHFKRAIRRKPDEHDFYYELARTYERLGREDKAATNLKKARRWAPDEANRERFSQKPGES